MQKFAYSAISCVYLLYQFKYINQMAKFTKDALQKIKNDPDLFAAVAKEMEVKPVSLGPILDRNGNSLNQYSVVKLVADYLGSDPEGLIEEDKTAKV